MGFIPAVPGSLGIQCWASPSAFKVNSFFPMQRKGSRKALAPPAAGGGGGGEG